MPLPTPNSDEGHDAFIQRCMSDDIAEKDFPNTDQRLAVCEKQWTEGKLMEKNTEKLAYERRDFQIDKVEVRAENDGMRLRGHAAVFDSESHDLGGFVEVIRRGAFAQSLEENDIRALHNHNDDMVIGRTSAGTLRLSEDERGLAAEMDLPDTTFARDLKVSVERGDINGMSFGFRVRPEGQQISEREDGIILRELRNIELIEVSTTPFPAYPETEVAQRSIRNMNPKCVNCEKRGIVLGQLVGTIRDNTNLTNERIGELAGLDQSTVSDLIQGEVACPPLVRLEGIAEAIGMPVERLIEVAENGDGCDYSNSRSLQGKRRKLKLAQSRLKRGSA